MGSFSVIVLAATFCICGILLQMGIRRVGAECRCKYCSYILHKGSGKCTECGSMNRKRDVVRGSYRISWRILGIIIFVILLGVFVSAYVPMKIDAHVNRVRNIGNP